MPNELDGKALETPSGNAATEATGTGDGNLGVDAAAPVSTQEGSEPGKDGTPSFYDGNPLNLAPDVYETHYKPMQGAYTRKSQELAAQRREVESQHARLADERAEIDRIRATLYQGAQAPRTAGEPPRPDAVALPDADFHRHIETLAQSGRRDEASALIVKRAAAPLVNEAIRPLLDQIAELKASLGTVTPTVHSQQRAAEIAHAWSSLSEENPVFGTNEVRQAAQAILRNPDDDVAALLDSENPAFRRAGLKMIGTQAASQVEMARRGVRTSRAADASPSGQPAKAGVEPKGPTSLGLSDLLDFYLTNPSKEARA